MAETNKGICSQVCVSLQPLDQILHQLKKCRHRWFLQHVPFWMVLDQKLESILHWMQILHLLHVTNEVLGTALVMFNDDNHNMMTLGDASTFTRVMSGCMSFVISRKHQQIQILTIVILQRNEKKSMLNWRSIQWNV